MTQAQQRLLDAAKAILELQRRMARGIYFSGHEDLTCGAELAAAVNDVEREAVDAEQFAMAAGDPRRA